MNMDTITGAAVTSKKQPSPRQRRGAKRRISLDSSRLGLAAAATVLAYFGLSDALANVVARNSTELAQVMAPWDGMIAGRHAERMFSMQPGGDRAADYAHLAREALRSEPMSAEAINVLGLQAQLRNEPGQTRDIFRYSIELTRRELPPRLWSIEDGVSRGDVTGVLREYDLALKTSRQAKDILFPVLVGAVEERQIRALVLRLLATDPVWTREFVRFATRSPIAPGAVASMIREDESGALDMDESDRVSLVDTLVNTSNPEAAWNFYEYFRPESARDGLRDPTFGALDRPSSVFDWQIQGFGFPSQSAQGTSLGISVPATESGDIVRQFMVLPAGRYRLQGRVSGIDQPRQSQPYWLVVCLDDSSELGRVTISSPAGESAQFEMPFTVSPGCTTQVLSLIARPTDAIRGVEGDIETVSIDRVGSNSGSR
jgi:hypothetical protein